MTPEELELISADGACVHTHADAFATSFYATLFDLDPATRSLFGDDLVVQRGKLVAELEFLVDAAAPDAESGTLTAFVERARDLGRRHVAYGVKSADYTTVGRALVAAVSEVVDDWDEHHAAAWQKLYRLISDVMREGAESQLFSG